MKIKVSKYNLNIHYRGSPGREEVELSNTRTAYVMHIPTKLSLSKKQPQAKIAIAFLFGQLHLNNVHMLFFTEAILLCAVRDAQCKTRESP